MPNFQSTPPPSPSSHKDSMIYERRANHCVPGRLAVVSGRFATATLNIWDRLGIEQAGFRTTLAGPSNQTLTYILKWQSMAEREPKWAAFANDPEWLERRAHSEAGGILVERIDNQFLAPTAFSALR
jgi:hypothetical protein